MGTPRNFHMNYDKRVGKARVHSYGGGAPRWVVIEIDGESLTGLQMEDCRDLRFALDRLISLTDGDD